MSVKASASSCILFNLSFLVLFLFLIIVSLMYVRCSESGHYYTYVIPAFQNAYLPLTNLFLSAPSGVYGKAFIDPITNLLWASDDVTGYPKYMPINYSIPTPSPSPTSTPAPSPNPSTTATYTNINSATSQSTTTSSTTGQSIANQSTTANNTTASSTTPSQSTSGNTTTSITYVSFPTTPPPTPTPSPLVAGILNAIVTQSLSGRLMFLCHFVLFFCFNSFCCSSFFHYFVLMIF